MGVLFLFLCGCDGTSWENTIRAKSYPQEAILTIPVGARVNEGDYLAYGGYRFAAEPEVAQKINNWTALQGMRTQLFEDSIGTGVVIEREDNYYFLGPIACEEDMIYEFSGMQRFIATEQGSIPVLLPLHFISDPFIRGRLGACIETGEYYRIKNDDCALNETVEQFLAFYTLVYGTDVTVKDENILLTDSHGDIVFSFFVQNDAHCFSIDIT